MVPAPPVEPAEVGRELVHPGAALPPVEVEARGEGLQRLGALQEATDPEVTSVGALEQGQGRGDVELPLHQTVGRDPGAARAAVAEAGAPPRLPAAVLVELRDDLPAARIAQPRDAHPPLVVLEQLRALGLDAAFQPEPGRLRVDVVAAGPEAPARALPTRDLRSSGHAAPRPRRELGRSELATETERRLQPRARGDAELDLREVGGDEELRFVRRELFVEGGEQLGEGPLASRASEEGHAPEAVQIDPTRLRLVSRDQEVVGVQVAMVVARAMQAPQPTPHRLDPALAELRITLRRERGGQGPRTRNAFAEVVRARDAETGLDLPRRERPRRGQPQPAERLCHPVLVDASRAVQLLPPASGGARELVRLEVDLQPATLQAHDAPVEAALHELGARRQLAVGHEALQFGEDVLHEEGPNVGIADPRDPALVAERLRVRIGGLRSRARGEVGHARQDSGALDAPRAIDSPLDYLSPG